ncbi:MAG TPA: hypothetical protein VLC48_03430, partial [Gemmatimonadota bacterium]|nr:hypothetical protein [Gemmatimonadota bacterium]
MSVLVFAEQRGGALRQAALETVTAGRRLADALGGVELAVVVLGPSGIETAADALGRHGAGPQADQRRLTYECQV